MKQPEYNLDYDKYADGLVPAIVQDAESSIVLMLGFMNESSLQETLSSGRVCFFSRTKNRLWTKGEESGNFLEVVKISQDCDRDTILIKAIPHGPVCHTGQDTCFGEINEGGFIKRLESVINERKEGEVPKSYVSGLFKKGINSIAQKLGEEAVELIIEAKDNDDQKFLDEAADLLFHYLILLNAKGKSLQDVEKVLKGRQNK